MPRDEPTHLLAGDIGATKSLLAIFSTGETGLAVIREERLESARFADLAALVNAFLAPGRSEDPDEIPGEIRAAAFGVAGARIGKEHVPANLPWRIDARRLASEIGIPRVRLVNDFEAVGRGIPRLSPADLLTLQEGVPEPRGPIALIGAGTGLGEGFLVWGTDGYEVHASEGGHADFAPRDAFEWGLLQRLSRRYAHVSYERALSGPGLAEIYGHVVESGAAPPGAGIRSEMEAEDPAAVITRHALSGTDEACGRALEIFLSIYGAEAGNLALKLLPTGGLYVAGGIAPRIGDRMAAGSFMESFRRKGRHRDLLERIPVRVILNPRVGLLGAAAIAEEEAGA
ncbi:MAG: glucokinase [Candidatus Eisenbacteria bacterium]|nr:glucokinase [Candidatus Eisenbacteria bacterium]